MNLQRIAVCLLFLCAAARFGAAAPPPPGAAAGFLQKQCFECHDAETQKGGLDLSSLKFDLDSAKTFDTWIKIHDRVRDGEMPPKKKPRPDGKELDVFLSAIADPMIAADRARAAAQGRSVWRRLNRYEYENALRDLLHAPWLQVRDSLPEDGEAFRFNKVGDALDVSHVQMARYLGAADYALRLTTRPIVDDKCAGMNVIGCCECLCCLAGVPSGLPRAAFIEIVPGFAR